MDKKGQKGNAFIWVIAIAGIFFLFQSGALDGIIGTRDNGVVNDDKAPSDRQTTLNINLEDRLAAVATSADGTFYFFNGDDTFYKTATTTSGTKSINVEFGRTYSYIVYDDDDSGTDYYPTSGTITATLSVQPLNVALDREGNIKIVSVQDVTDLNSNVSQPATGAPIDFTILWQSNMSNAGTLNPIIILDINSTSMDSASVAGGYEEITCPSRLSTEANRKKICFRKEGLVIAKAGVQSVSAQVQTDASTQVAASADSIAVTMADESMIRAPNYITAGKSAFTMAAEDTDDSNVGEPTDAAAGYISFQG